MPWRWRKPDEWAPRWRNTLKVGIGLPFIQPTASWTSIRKLVERADEGAFFSFTVTDRIVYDSYEVITLLAAVAAITQRLRLQTAVLVGPLRNAAALAKQSATLDAISGGRFTLGLGVGSRIEDSLVAGVDHHTRGKRFDEQLDVMKRIWAGDHFDGAQYEVGPAPVQKGGPELLLGGTADRAIDRVGRVADGYVIGGRAWNEEWTAEIMEKVNAAWTKHGRAGRPRYLATLPVAFGPDADDLLEEMIGHYYGGRGDAGAPRRSAGNPNSESAVRDLIAMHEKLGTDEIVFRPTSFKSDQIDPLFEAVIKP